jgi:hypothetical protein
MHGAAAGSENAAVPSAVAGSQVAAVAGSQADAVAVTGCQTAAVHWQVLKLQQSNGKFFLKCIFENL